MTTRRSFVVGSVAIGSFALARKGHAAAEYRWKWQSFWQPNTVNQQAFERFAARVKERSGGRIEIEALPVNAVVPPGEMLDAVRAGVIQGTNGGTGYYVGKDAAFALLADLNCAWENPRQLVGWYYEGGGNDLARELYGRYGSFYLGPVLGAWNRSRPRSPSARSPTSRASKCARPRAWVLRSGPSSASA